MKVLLMMVVVVALYKRIQETIITHKEKLKMCEYKKVVDLVEYGR